MANVSVKLLKKSKSIFLHRSSILFQPVTAVQKNIQPKNNDTTSKSQKLMLDLGIIRQSSPGNFHLLPLGVRAFNKLCGIVDDEMETLGAGKLIFPTLTNVKLWEKTGRLNDVSSELFKLKDRHSAEYILSPTFEETAADLLSTVSPLTYKQLPIRLYQITSKFRDEMKPRFGLMRARQFMMKDLYTFDADEASARGTYEDVCSAYDRIFRRLGVGFVKGTTGNMGGSISHEYHYLSDIGEDEILSCTKCGFTANVELTANKCPQCNSADDVTKRKGIEVGHTFLLGDKYSKPLRAVYTSQDARQVELQMGSYGLGLTRILAAAIEVLSTEHEIRWPDELAPYKTIIIPPKSGSKEDKASPNIAEDLYTSSDLKNEILLDDRTHMTIGRRVLEAKRTGYPRIVVIGTKSLENPPLFEAIVPGENRQMYLSRDELLSFIKS